VALQAEEAPVAASTGALTLEEVERPERRASALVGERLGGQADMSAIGWESRRPGPLAETSNSSQIQSFKLHRSSMDSCALSG